MTSIDLPPIGSIWRQKYGPLYQVYDHTNLRSRQAAYPPMVSYKNLSTGEKFSRPLAEWHQSMDLIAETS